MNIHTLGLLFFCGFLGTFQFIRADTVEHTNCIAAPEQSEAGSEKASESEEDSFKRSHIEAECFRKAAARAAAEWLKTEQLLKQSSEEAENGHWDVASELVKKARFQAEAALQQAGYEAQAWKRRVVRKKETGE